MRRGHRGCTKERVVGCCHSIVARPGRPAHHFSGGRLGAGRAVIRGATQEPSCRPGFRGKAAPDAGVLEQGRVALYLRRGDRNAGQELRDTLRELCSKPQMRAAAVVDLAVAGLSPFTVPELIRLAEQLLEKTSEAGGGVHRLTIAGSTAPA